MQPKADDRDPELRFDVVYSSRSAKLADAAAGRLRAHRLDVLQGVGQHRSRRGHRTRVHRVLVRRPQVAAAARLLAATPILADDTHDPPRPASLRRSLGRSAYDGLTTAILIAAAMALIVVLLLLAAGD